MTPSVLDLIRDAETVAELEAIRHEAQVHEATMTAYLRRMAELTTSGHEAEPIQIATWKSTRAAQDDDHEPGKRNKTQGERLREAVIEADVDLFHDAELRAYASFDVQDHQETWPVRSTGFRNYVRWLYFRANGKAPRAGDLADSWPPSKARPNSMASRRTSMSASRRPTTASPSTLGMSPGQPSRSMPRAGAM